jgi:secreted trypsin-like serine protease
VLESPSAYTPIELMTPTLDTAVQVGDFYDVAGWGTLREGGSLATTLQKVKVPLVDQRTCSNAYDGIVDSMVCAGFADGGKDSCQGDSGGPMFLTGSDGKFYQAGVVSFGSGCARPDAYGVYTRVSSFSSFICDSAGVGCSDTRGSKQKKSRRGRF